MFFRYVLKKFGQIYSSASLDVPMSGSLKHFKCSKQNSLEF